MLPKRMSEIRQHMTTTSYAEVDENRLRKPTILLELNAMDEFLEIAKREPSMAVAVEELRKRSAVIAGLVTGSSGNCPCCGHKLVP